MESDKLIKALKEGKGLCKKDCDKDDPTYVYGVEFLYYDNEYKGFDRKGWGSALGTVEQRLLDIIKNPENWEICGPIEDREWLKDF
jgi:hypothetical protein